MWNRWLRKAIGWTLLSGLGIAFVGCLGLMMGIPKAFVVLGLVFGMVAIFALGLYLVDA